VPRERGEKEQEMAKHKKKRRHLGKHKRRHMRGFGASEIVADFQKSAKIEDLAIGAGIGLAGTAGSKLILSQIPSAQLAVPDVIANNLTIIGSAITGGAAYFLERQKHPERARAHLFGALLWGVSSWLWQTLQSAVPSAFGDVVSVNLSGGGKAKQLKGVLVQNRSGYQGFIVANKSPGFPPRNGMSGLLAPNATNAGRPQDFTSYMEPDSDPMEEQYST
jgi:hypothetical protein